MGAEEECTVAEIYDSGTKLRTLEGSEWQLVSDARPVTDMWLPGDSVVIRKVEGDEFPYEIVNQEDSVGAKQIS